MIVVETVRYAQEAALERFAEALERLRTELEMSCAGRLLWRAAVRYARRRHG